MSYAHTLIQPRRRQTLAEPWHRLKGRWRNGGVEEYSLGQSHGMRQLRRLHLRAVAGTISAMGRPSRTTRTLAPSAGLSD
ncbi:MAG: hypothetical protein ACRD37_02245, partial [Candidatus Acidiferrales bacterium]